MGQGGSPALVQDDVRNSLTKRGVAKRESVKNQHSRLLFFLDGETAELPGVTDVIWRNCYTA